MNATSTTTHCNCCGELVEGAQHLLLCDCCLDARLAALERSSGRASKWTGALRWPSAALADGWSGARAARDALRLAV
jgi:anaerobic ribonucleoside-triphosphate reductase